MVLNPKKIRIIFDQQSNFINFHNKGSNAITLNSNFNCFVKCFKFIEMNKNVNQSWRLRPWNRRLRQLWPNLTSKLGFFQRVILTSNFVNFSSEIKESLNFSLKVVFNTLLYLLAIRKLFFRRYFRVADDYFTINKS